MAVLTYSRFSAVFSVSLIKLWNFIKIGLRNRQLYKNLLEAQLLVNQSIQLKENHSLRYCFYKKHALYAFSTVITGFCILLRYNNLKSEAIHC